MEMKTNTIAHARYIEVLLSACTIKCTPFYRRKFIKKFSILSSELIEARCSCPDVSAKTGRCKHVIGLLLNYEDRSSAVCASLLTYQ
jgi:uncharacterized Zn finger protein